MKVGIFPGSFNPIHVGHLAIANYICEYEEYDEIWFLVTPQSPQKAGMELMEQEQRLALVEKAIENYDKFKSCTIEWEMPKPTYTINTLQKLRMLFPDNKFELVIGSDNWDSFHRWKDYQVILNNFKVLVYPRQEGPIYTNHPNVRLCKNAPKIEISASFIRKSIKKGKDVRFFLPESAFESIVKSGVFMSEEVTKEE